MHEFRVQEKDPKRFMGGERLLYLQANPSSIGFDEDEEEKMKDESDYTLADILEKEEYKGKTTMTYEYDMGDGWEHEIFVLGRADDNLGKALGLKDRQRVLCIAGEGHACAEDCGGPGGWEDLKDTFKKTRGVDADRKAWYKNFCSNGDQKGLDPWKWDILKINAELAKVCSYQSLSSTVQGILISSRSRSEDQIPGCYAPLDVPDIVDDKRHGQVDLFRPHGPSDEIVNQGCSQPCASTSTFDTEPSMY